MKKALAAVIWVALFALVAPASSYAELSATPDTFKTRCDTAQLAQPIDPILSQNSAWTMPHSHDFFGAPGVTNETKSAELVAQTVEAGSSRCLSTNLAEEGEAGDEFDGAAYWVPTLHIKKGEEDVAIKPAFMFAYYQRVWDTQTSAGVQMTHVEEIPDSTRIVAGSASDKNLPTYVSKWICLNDPTPTIQGSELPICEGKGSNARIAARINFPYCLSNSVESGTSWESKYGSINAFAKDGNHPEPKPGVTNVAYPKINSGIAKCPKEFDRELPKIFLTVVYPLKGDDAGYNWTEAGGAYLGGGEKGMTMSLKYMHADFMNGWVKEDNPSEPSPLHNSTCVKGDGSPLSGCGLTTLIAECVNGKNGKGEYAEGEEGTGCGTIESTRPTPKGLQASASRQRHLWGAGDGKGQHQELQRAREAAAGGWSGVMALCHLE